MEKYTVTLEKPHTHQGRLYAVGDEINVSLAEAEFLAKLRIIKKIPKANTATKLTKQENENG